MNCNSKYFLLSLLLILSSITASAQLIERAEEFIHDVFESSSDSDETSAPKDTVDLTERIRQDSIRMQEMMLELQEMKLNEILLRTELDNVRNLSEKADSIKIAEQKRSIDSLRSVTPGVPVIIGGDTLFTLYAERGGCSAINRAANVCEIVTKIGKTTSLRRDSVHTLDYDGFIDLMYGDKVILSITDKDAIWQNTTRQELADLYAPLLSDKIRELKNEHSILKTVKRVVLFLVVIIAQYLLFRLTNFLFRKLRKLIIRLKQQKLKPIVVRDYELLNTRQQSRIMIFVSNILRYIVLLLQLMLSVPLLFAIFPQTEKLAQTIFHYILEPIKMVIGSIVDYVPNLFMIIVIWYCIKYIIKGIHYIAKEIANERLKISGFYPDWAIPTFNIIRFLLYAFMVVMIYPYLPGSHSGVFQGISVFVGLIISLGSSTVIGNIISGLVITYMRPFKIGDRIKLNDTTGNVVEKTPFVTRLRTPKNEIVTIPNSFIMSSHTVNYSASAREYGLIIHTTVTIGYDVPWRQVHQLLINAARETNGVLEHPKPFVLETELQDYYPCYQLNAYIKDADRLGDIYSELHQNIQDTFNEAGVEIMSPQYIATRDGNESTIPADYIKTKKK